TRMREPVARDAALSSMRGVSPILPMNPLRISMAARLSIARTAVKVGRCLAKRQPCQVEGRRPRRVDIDDRGERCGEGGAKMILRLDAEQPCARQFDSMKVEVAGIVRRLA